MERDLTDIAEWLRAVADEQAGRSAAPVVDKVELRRWARVLETAFDDIRESMLEAEGC
jgi:hypothetical protein